MSSSTETFYALNKLPLLDKQHLTCAGCGKWLLNEIYSDCDGCNYCQQCKHKNDNNGDAFVRCYTLEHVLGNAGLKFPCPHEQCDYIGNARILSTHLDANHLVMNCATCSKTINEGQIHLECAHDVHVDELHVDVSRLLSSAPGVHHVFNVTLNRFKHQHNFFVVIDVASVSASVKVASASVHWLATPEFTIELQNADIHKGVISAEVSRGQLPVRVPWAHNARMHLYFGGYFEATKMPIQVCPICFDSMSITSAVHQCAEGHWACANCMRTTKKCPICSTTIRSKEVMLESLFPEYTHTCRNVQYGCIFVSKWPARNAHLQQCSFTPTAPTTFERSYKPDIGGADEAIQAGIKVKDSEENKRRRIKSDNKEEVARPMWPADNGRVKRMVNQFSTDRTV